MLYIQLGVSDRLEYRGEGAIAAQPAITKKSCKKMQSSPTFLTPTIPKSPPNRTSAKKSFRISLQMTFQPAPFCSHAFKGPCLACSHGATRKTVAWRTTQPLAYSTELRINGQWTLSKIRKVAGPKIIISYVKEETIYNAYLLLFHNYPLKG